MPDRAFLFLRVNDRTPAMTVESAEPRINYKEVAREAIGSIGDNDDSVEASV
jgi:hypothetical protein